ncbi:aspartokinase [Cenarchaeum symbiosum A]|uniref:Aspartokinase n=1 Tax=Cenarchaeum symbiosum (strain A) TaxID=414004 RepID=A0RXH8_CENSY|nr:aspartokinase [Cenarchaeum symbiosum A]
MDEPGKIRDAAAFVASQGGEVVAVCSAASGTTDNLMGISGLIRKGDGKGARAAADGIMRYTRELAEGAVSVEEDRERLSAALDGALAELNGLIDGMALLGEVTPRSSDYLLSFGERLSSEILASAISERDRKAEALAGNEAGIVTDSNFGGARPLMDTTGLRVSKKIGGLLLEGVIPVVGGFVGADQYGRITTLGRGGTDYTATTVGASIKADEIWLMSDMDGLMTANPRVVGGARVLDEVSYAEAVEMAMFGAKQIHPRTFEPLMGTRIPMRIRSAVNTGNPGTLVTASPGPESGRTIKCVSALRHNALIDIRGGGMVGEAGTAAGIFSTLAGAGVNVMMISQNPSESSITVVIKKSDMDRAVDALEIGLAGKVIKKLEVTPDVAIVALIGSGMRGTVGIASRVFGAAASKGLNVVMITQGSSELNLAFVVGDDDCWEAVRALHDEFGLGAPGGRAAG